MNPVSITPLQPAQPLTSLKPIQPAESGPGEFVKLVGKFTKDVNELQQQAADQVAQLATGKTDNIHQVMLSLGKAESSFNYMMEVRSRLIDAYKEVMRMPL